MEQTNKTLSCRSDLAAAITAACGSAENYFAAMHPSRLIQITQRHEAAREKGLNPETVLLIKTYGDTAVDDNLRRFVSFANLALDQRWEPVDVGLITQLLLGTAEARLMWYTVLLGFFRWLIEGRSPLYRSTPANVMQAFQRYAKEALPRQRKMQQELAERRKAAKPSDGMTFAEYAKRRGIKENNPIDAAMKICGH